MKKPLILASTLACLSISISVAAQPSWVEVVSTQLGDRVLVNKNSIRPIKQGRLRRVIFTAKTLYSTPDTDGTVKTFGEYSANCLSNELGTSQFTKYDDRNQILNHIRQWSGFIPVQEGSVGEALHEYACQYLDR